MLRLELSLTKYSNITIPIQFIFKRTGRTNIKI